MAIQAKGRLNEDSVALLRDIGIRIDDSKRKFLAQAPDFPLEVLYLRDDDIPQVVAAGTADLGIVGLNEVAEHSPDGTPEGSSLQIVRQLGAGEEIGDIPSVDVSSVYDLQIWYGTRFQVKLGGTSELSYKLDYMLAAISQLESYQSGVLDLTFQEAKKATFIPWSS